MPDIDQPLLQFIDVKYLLFFGRPAAAFSPHCSFRISDVDVGGQMSGEINARFLPGDFFSSVLSDSGIVGK